MFSNTLVRVVRLPFSSHSTPVLIHLRSIRFQAHDAFLDQDDLEEARKWHASFKEDSLPKGHVSYSRSSGPGGQHVNKYVPIVVIRPKNVNRVKFANMG